MEIPVSPNTKFILSTSGSEAALKRHNEALKSFGADVVYFTFGRAITAEEYAGLLKSPIVRGGAVTGQGLKTGILPFVTHIDPLAEKLGAINTIVNDNGELHGYNTDAYGFKTAISNYLEKSDKPVKTAVIYGNGGVAGVAVRVLQELGLEVGMAGRNQEHVDKKMAELGLDKVDGPFDLVVNATPISSKPVEEAEGLVPLLHSAQSVFDHSMPEMDGGTNYLREYCEAHNLDFISGNDMYVPQMIEQWTLFLNGIEGNSGEALSVTGSDIRSAWKLS
jgi:shikimate 5-dehydrogenase